MAGQGVDRREILRMLAAASALSACPGFDRWTFAFGSGAQTAEDRPSSRGYVPRFFTADEYARLSLLARLIIPSDDTPGADEAGVSEFIDTMAAHDPPLQPRLRRGLAWVDAHARLMHGKPFEALTTEEHIAFLRPLAYAAERRPGQDEGRRFFELMREYTVMGYYTSRVGLQALGYPGLQMYAESPGCPDPGDPTHAHRRERAAEHAFHERSRDRR